MAVSVTSVHHFPLHQKSLSKLVYPLALSWIAVSWAMSHCATWKASLKTINVALHFKWLRFTIIITKSTQLITLLSVYHAIFGNSQHSHLKSYSNILNVLITHSNPFHIHHVLFMLIFHHILLSSARTSSYSHRTSCLLCIWKYQKNRN